MSVPFKGRPQDAVKAIGGALGVGTTGALVGGGSSAGIGTALGGVLATAAPFVIGAAIGAGVIAGIAYLAKKSKK